MLTQINTEEARDYAMNLSSGDYDAIRVDPSEPVTRRGGVIRKQHNTNTRLVETVFTNHTERPTMKIHNNKSATNTTGKSGKKKKKTAHGTQEWADFNVNIQTGCENDCLYCYARERITATKRKDI